jgi:asparagine synthetase B (glutamine-hydrolysing)
LPHLPTVLTIVGRMASASRISALPWVDGTFDPEVLAETLININGQEATSYTLLPGVRRLPAGHAMLVEADGNIRIDAWWNTLDHMPEPRPSLDEQAEEFPRSVLRCLPVAAAQRCTAGNRA